MRAIQLFSTLFCLSSFAALAFNSQAQEPAKTAPKTGDIVCKSNFSDPVERAKWSKAPFASWTPEGKDGQLVLKVEVHQEEASGQHVIKLPIDLKPYEGMRLWLSCQAKAKNVSKPLLEWNGAKWMLHYKSPSKEFWKNQHSVFGSFDWKELGFSAYVEKGAENAELCLGLETSSGEVWFDNVKIEVASGGRAFKLPEPPKNPPLPFTGHEGLERLRGAMSPLEFKEGDFEVFANEWNANLVRWQIVRDWGKRNTDLDLDEYDKWLDGKMREIDALLVAARRLHFKVVIDLHSPPGGRLGDFSCRMFYEQKYNDHFVEAWRRLALRYHGNAAVWGYDLVNEPVENKPVKPGMGSLETQRRAAKAIREIDPATAIIAESLEMDSPSAFAEMEPLGVSNVIYEVHMYEPGSFTHQGVGSNPKGFAYPGKLFGVQYDKAKLREILKPVRDFQRACNVQIYVGEFSAIRWAPGAAQYLSDCIDIFEEYGWDWSYHAFREWDGWSVEHSSDFSDHAPAASPSDRLKVLLKWYAKNHKPVYKD